ncbi:sulfite exporter TauE/SafE family protein [Vibrio sp. CK2-1]|uniref:TSUP family transporter n=1 Tax=Vibrio sp. CK2-1 TaxID=2912249 RepID=UPI001F28F011|nr:sulfite exporter TauE/SafE family protein [Vibrio sp. CK2-1]
MIILWASIFTLFAGIVRGYSGFGFSVIAVLCLNLVYSPIESIALAIGLDLMSSLWLIPGIRQQINTQLLKPLMLGMLAALPFSLALINYIPSQQLKMLIASVCFIAGCLMILNLKLTWLNTKHAFSAGMVSGFTMTTASAGGPPLIIYLMNLSLSQKELRATSIAFFISSSLISLLGLIYLDMISSDTIIHSLFLLPSAVIGNIIGKKLYFALPQIPHRWFNAPLLMMLASIIFIT